MPDERGEAGAPGGIGGPGGVGAPGGLKVPARLGGLEGLDAFCTRALAAHGCPSLSLAVAERGEVVLTRAYGLADVAGRRPATPETVYGLASITKAFTAMAVCLAADDGLVDLDEPVRGGYRWPAPTVRQVLQHRGGFPAFYSFHYDCDHGAGPSPIDVERYRTLVREPGSDFEYSNLGYRELGRLLERATGQDLGGFLSERICEPLGLRDFSFGSSPTGPAPVAARYTADGRPYPTCFTDHAAAGAGWATAGDVALFAHTAHRLLQPATAEALFDGVPINEHLGYGLGRIVSSGAGPVIRSHGGGMGGIAAMMIEIPERETSVAVLTNSTGKAARDAVVDFVAGGLAPGFHSRLLNPVTEQIRPARPAPGEWDGEIGTAEGDVRLRITVRPDHRVDIRLAGGAPVTAPVSASRRWDLMVSAALQLPTADARLNSPSLLVQLRAEDGRLTGRATAYKDGDRAGLLGAFLVHPCVLRPV